MKKILLLLLSVTLQLIAYSQTNYFPNESGMVSKDGYTYVYQSDKYGGGFTELFNQDIIFYGLPNTNKDGTKMDVNVAFNRVSTITDANISVKEIKAIISEQFSEAQKAFIGDSKLFIGVYVDSSTGEVKDVGFSFYTRSNYKYIPIEVYRNIELKLKQCLKYQVNEYGARLNYISIHWAQVIS